MVLLRRKRWGNAGETSGETSGKIINLIKKNQDLTIPELAEIIGVTERSIERNIEQLKKDELVKRIGAAKGGYWQIINKKRKK